jgi:hypothetical protein
MNPLRCLLVDLQCLQCLQQYCLEYLTEVQELPQVQVLEQVGGVQMLVNPLQCLKVAEHLGLE